MASRMRQNSRSAAPRRNPHPRGGIPPARAARRRHLTCTPRVTSIDKTSARTSGGYLLATPPGRSEVSMSTAIARC
jgi:hypothetical protein